MESFLTALVAVVAAAKNGSVCVTSSCTEQQKLVPVWKGGNLGAGLSRFWLRHLNWTSNAHFLPQDRKSDKPVALQVKKLSFSLCLELYLERELVSRVNIWTSNWSQISICNPFSLSLGINLLQSDSLNPKSLSYTFFSKPNSQNFTVVLTVY